MNDSQKLTPPAEGPSDDDLDLLVIAIQALRPEPSRGSHDLATVDRGREILREWLARLAHQPAPPAVQGSVLSQAVIDAVAEALGQSAYDCSRVWSAWGVGTMGEDDFELIAENGERVVEIAEAAIIAYLNGQQPTPPAEGEGAEVVAELRGLADYFSGEGYSAEWINQLTDAADLLEQRHPAPVPVSERLPGAEDCDGRDPECVKQWPDCFDGGYDPSCCRFPKSCSCGPRALPLHTGEVE